MLFLYTGHKACRLPIPPKFLYHGDDSGIDRLMGSMADFARGYQLEYLLLTPDDYYRDLDAKGTHGFDGSHAVRCFPKAVTEPAALRSTNSILCAAYRVQSQQVTVRVILLFCVLAFSLFAQKKPITIDAVIQQSHESETPPVVWAPDGKQFALFSRQRGDAL